MNTAQLSYAAGRKLDQARLFRKRLQDGLPYPPYSIGYELELAGLIEAFGGADKAEIALIDEIA
jgi:hypothetical protein